MKIASFLMITAAIALAPSFAGAKQSKKYLRAAQPSQIACTKYGCFPIAPNCQTTTQFNWQGDPTGYDAIVCRR